MKLKLLILLVSLFVFDIVQAQTKRLIYEDGYSAGIVNESALKVSIDNLLNVPTANRILYSNGTNLTSATSLTFDGNTLTATKFTSTGTAVTGKSYLKNQIVGIPSESNLDFTNFSWGDKDYLKDVAFWGDVTVSITGAGTFTNTRANINNMFDMSGSSLQFSGLNATTTDITITCDLKQNQNYYSRALVMPFIVYRTESYTRFNACKVEVSLDAIEWYTITDATNILSEYSTAWFSPEVSLPAATSYTFRYVRYTLSDKLATGSQASFAVSMLGLKNYNAPIFPSLITKAGGNIWGDFKVYDEGGVTTPAITLAKSGSVTATNFVSSVATGTQPYVTFSTTLNTNLNADLLDGQHGSYYQSATNINGGTLSDTRLSANVSLDNIDNAFSVNQTIPNATANGHALNRITADGRFLSTAAITGTTGNYTKITGTNTIGDALLKDDANGTYFESSAIERMRLHTDGRINFGGITSRSSRVNVLGGINADSLKSNNYTSLSGPTYFNTAPDFSPYVDGTDRIYVMKGDGELRSKLLRDLLNDVSANDTFALTGTSGDVFNLSSTAVTTVDLGIYTNSISTNSVIEFRLNSSGIFYDNQQITINSSKKMTCGQGVKIRLADSGGTSLVQLCNDALSLLTEDYEFNNNPLGRFTITFVYSKKRNLWRISYFKSWDDL